MQKSRVLCLSFLLVFLLLPVFSIAGTTKLKVSELNWDWGRVPQNSFIYHKFWIKNVGTDTLRGLNVRVAWGCTKAPLEKTELAIGDSTELLVSYHSGIVPGRVDKYATISCADTTIQPIRITLHTQVVPNIDTTFGIELSNSTLDFTVAKGEKPKEKKLYLKNAGEEKFKVSLIDYPDEYFKIKLGKDLKPGKSLKVRVKPDKELPEEEIKTSFTLELEGKEKTRITIPLVYQDVSATSQKK